MRSRSGYQLDLIYLLTNWRKRLENLSIPGRFHLWDWLLICENAKQTKSF